MAPRCGNDGAAGSAAFVDEDDGPAFFLGFQQTTGPKLPQTPYFNRLHQSRRIDGRDILCGWWITRE